MKRIIALFVVVGVVVLFFIPNLIITLINEPRVVDSISDIEVSDVAVILGAGVTEDRQPTPLLVERLEAGILLYENELVEFLVVSNTFVASEVMQDYLIDSGVAKEDIIFDGDAVITTDSCDFIQNNYQNSSVILITQKFHAARSLYQCDKYEIDSIVFPAELSNSIDRSKTPFLQKYSIRFYRSIRVSAMDWLVVLSIYE